jgi:hypothetical protein
MDWLRHNKPNPDHVDEPTVYALANLAGVPTPQAKLSVREKRDIVADVAEWLRSKEPDESDMDEPTVRRACAQQPLVTKLWMMHPLHLKTKSRLLTMS